MKNTKNKKYSAFSFIELMVAIFILSVIMLASVSVFANVVLARKNATNNLNNVSAGREAMQVMAKNMRVSSQLNYASGGGNEAIYFYNSSRGVCMSYRFANNTVESATAGLGGVANESCPSAVTSYSYARIIDSDVVLDGSFLITPSSVSSSPKVIGKGTITILVDGKDRLQTTVSFLDYVGIL